MAFRESWMMCGMPEVRIGSATEFLSLVPQPPVGAPDSVIATLRLDGLAATTQVVSNYTSGFQDLADFFGELADNWRGWQGARRWESLEHDLTIEARHQYGHVTLVIEVRCDRLDWGNSGWRVTGDVAIDPGEQLSSVAKDVASLARG